MTIHQSPSKRALKAAFAVLFCSEVASALTTGTPAFLARGATRSNAASQATPSMGNTKLFATRVENLGGASPFDSTGSPSISPPGSYDDRHGYATATVEMARSILQNNNAAIDWIIDGSVESLLNVGTKSFSGSESTAPEPATEWALRGILPSEFDQDRRDLYRYLLTKELNEYMGSNAIFFGHQATSLGNDDGSNENAVQQAMASAVFLRVFDPQVEFEKKTDFFADALENFGAFLGFAKDGITGQLPAPLRNIQNLALLLSRFPDLKEALKTTQQQHGPQERHLYVNLVAMDPDFQGRGFGKQLMNQVAELGDALGVPCYLECAGERNPRFYEKFGFRIVHESILNAEEEGGPDLSLFHMTREPQTQKSS